MTMYYIALLAVAVIVFIIGYLIGLSEDFSEDGTLTINTDASDPENELLSIEFTSENTELKDGNYVHFKVSIK